MSMYTHCMHFLQWLGSFSLGFNMGLTAQTPRQAAGTTCWRAPSAIRTTSSPHQPRLSALPSNPLGAQPRPNMGRDMAHVAWSKSGLSQWACQVGPQVGHVTRVIGFALNLTICHGPKGATFCFQLPWTSGHTENLGRCHVSWRRCLWLVGHIDLEGGESGQTNLLCSGHHTLERKHRLQGSSQISW